MSRRNMRAAINADNMRKRAERASLRLTPQQAWFAGYRAGKRDAKKFKPWTETEKQRFKKRFGWLPDHCSASNVKGK